ncbi:MAG: HAD family phosphatase, partial [Clostridiales bacterium]
MNFQGAIFDMDGTIIDSMSIYRTLGSNFLKKYHITPPYDLHKKIESMTLESSAIYFAENFSLNMTPQEVLRQWHEDVAFEYENNVPLKEYTREFLQKLHKKNIKLCVATLTNQELAQKVLRRLGVLDLFQFIITAEEV